MHMHAHMHARTCMDTCKHAHAHAHNAHDSVDKAIKMYKNHPSINKLAFEKSSFSFHPIGVQTSISKLYQKDNIPPKILEVVLKA